LFHFFLMMNVILLASLATLARAIEVTKSDWDAKTAGKKVFVKFFAPWCGHCKKMKPAWDKLMQDYADHESILVADVDCIGDGKSKCDEIGVEGFPTIKYGAPNNLEDYKGGRDYEALEKFAKANLGPTCSPERTDLCDDRQQKLLEEFMALSLSELKTKIKEKDEEISAAEKELKDLFQKLEKQYEEAQKAKEKKEKAIRDAGLGLMKSVQAHRKVKELSGLSGLSVKEKEEKTGDKAEAPPADTETQANGTASNGTSDAKEDGAADAEAPDVQTPNASEPTEASGTKDKTEVNETGETVAGQPAATEADAALPNDTAGSARDSANTSSPNVAATQGGMEDLGPEAPKKTEL